MVINNKKKKKHPKGLTVLFFTEMWERFGFYLLLGIFTLYMIDGKDGFPGMGFTDEKAADIYGTYLALVYLTPFFGGLIADRLLGCRLSITIGGILFSLGYMGLSINNETAFYSSLLLIVLGNGFFKPNISALVGKLYEKEEFKDKKATGFNIFYMGINIGAFICNFIAAYLRINYGWGWAFMAAGVGMLLGVIWFWTGQMYATDIKEVDKISPKRDDEKSIGSTLASLFVPAFAAAALGWFIPGNIFGADSTDAFLFFCIPVILFYVNVWRKADEDEKQPISALLSVFAVVIVFWAIFHQNGSALTYWTQRNTKRAIPEAMVSPISSLHLNKEVTTELREVEKRDAHGIPVKDENGNILTEMGSDPYFSNLPKEEWPESGKLNLFSTELFQSINPGFIILFTPLVVGFFGLLRRRGKEPPTPSKIAWGLFITGLSALVMVLAAVMSKNGLDKASAAWLFGTYGVITIGELCLSPMGLALVSQLSPKRTVSLMMGGWFLSTAIGNKLSGVLSGLWNFYEVKAYFFLTNFGLAMVSVILILFLLPWLKKVVKDHDA